MKTIIKFLIALVAMIGFSFNAFAQKVPSGQYSVCASENGVYLVVWGAWPQQTMLHFVCTTKQVKSMNLQQGSADMGTQGNYEFSVDDATNSFIAVETWKKFALRIIDEIVIFEGGFAEKAPYKLHSVNVEPHSFEVNYNSGTLIFQRGEKILPVKIEKWNGDLPKIGEQVVIGRDTGGDNYFALVERKVLEPTKLAQKQMEKKADPDYTKK